MIHHYNPVTGEWTGSTNDGVIMSFSTTAEKPQTGEHEVALYLDSDGQPPIAINGGSWVVKPDHRGRSYWMADRSMRTIEEIGIEPPPGALDADPGPSPAEMRSMLLADMTASVQSYVDAPAREWGYDDARSAATYANDAHPQFAAEAAAIVAFRSACWVAAGAIRDAVLTGSRGIPTQSEVIAELPPKPTRPSP